MCAVKPLLECLQPNHQTPVVIYSRVSELPQVSNGSLEKQKLRMWNLGEPELLNRWFSDPRNRWSGTFPFGASVRVKGLVTCQERATYEYARPELKRVAKMARKRKAIILAQDITRLLHPKRFHVHDNPIAELTPAEMDHLQSLVSNVSLATLIPPNTPYSELKSIVIRLGQAGSEKKAGRRKETDLRLLRTILYYADEQGERTVLIGRREIAKRASKRLKEPVTPSQVQRYLNKPIPGYKDLTWEQARQGFTSVYPTFLKLKESGAFD